MNLEQRLTKRATGVSSRRCEYAKTRDKTRAFAGSKSIFENQSRKRTELPLFNAAHRFRRATARDGSAPIKLVHRVGSLEQHVEGEQLESQRQVVSARDIRELGAKLGLFAEIVEAWHQAILSNTNERATADVPCSTRIIRTLLSPG
jgi:hypothetical protein